MRAELEVLADTTDRSVNKVVVRVVRGFLKRRHNRLHGVKRVHGRNPG